MNKVLKWIWEWIDSLTQTIIMFGILILFILITFNTAMVLSIAAYLFADNEGLILGVTKISTFMMWFVIMFMSAMIIQIFKKIFNKEDKNVN